MLVNRYFYAAGFTGPLDQTSLKTRWFEAGPRCLFEQCVLASGQSDLLSIAAGPLSRHNDGRTKCPFSGFDLPESNIHIIHNVWWFYYRTSLLNIRLDHHRGYWLIHFIEFGCRSRYPRTRLSLICPLADQGKVNAERPWGKNWCVATKTQVMTILVDP